ncbi:MAG: PHP domain-containing protein [Dehalococcoidales bacterium]|nr:PHP domain-containing protein [Dehalococcoidales bacterium]
MLKADFHIHSRYSMDCNTSLDQIIRTCLRKKINCVAIADHGAIEGALQLKKIAPFYVIVAEEILTTRGEIMGMFLRELVPSGLSIDESIRRIKEQGGLFCAQHPFDKVRHDALQADVMDEVVDRIDLVEVFNSRSPLLRSSEMAREFAEKHHKPGSAGSDAHAAFEIGNAYVEMPEFKGKEDFLAALSQGKVTGRRASILTHFYSLWARLRK